jgi:hypothetical protein
MLSRSHTKLHRTSWHVDIPRCVAAPIREYKHKMWTSCDNTYQYKYFHEYWASWEHLDSLRTLWYYLVRCYHHSLVSSGPHGGAFHHPLSRLLGSESELVLTPVHSWTLVCHPQLQSQVIQASHIQVWLKFGKLLFPKCLYHIKQILISISSAVTLHFSIY